MKSTYGDVTKTQSHIILWERGEFSDDFQHIFSKFNQLFTKHKKTISQKIFQRQKEQIKKLEKIIQKCFQKYFQHISAI